MAVGFEVGVWLAVAGGVGDWLARRQLPADALEFERSWVLQKQEEEAIEAAGFHAGAADETPGEKKKRPRLVRNVAMGVVVLLVALCAAGVWAYATGLLYPATAAAKYGMFDYLDESEVTDYIMTYKEQMGYGESTDDEWAAFLAAYNLTPDRLRLSTISQLLSDKIVEKKCAERGLSVSDSEIDASVDALKQTLGIVDDETWSTTLELYGQNEADLRDVYRLELLKQKLCTAEVEMPTPGEDEVRDYIGQFATSRQASEAASASSSEEYQALMEEGNGSTLRHSYRFVLKAAGDEPTLEESEQVELIRQEFLESGADVDTFATLVALYCNDDETKESTGSMGWDADLSSYSEAFMRVLQEMDEGEVSSVFTDGDEVCFIWVDQMYFIPCDEEGISDLDLSSMPTSLYQYFSDCEAYALWSEASSAYLNDLVASMDVTVYEMPADVPYNVDMSSYLVESDE